MHIKDILISILLILFISLVLIKVFVFDYTPSTVLPETGYSVTLKMEASGHGDKINIKATLPISNRHQEIFDEQFESGEFDFSNNSIGENRIGKWRQFSAQGKQEITYRFNVISKEVAFVLPDKFAINKNKAPVQYLEKTELIQTGDYEILDKLKQLNLNSNSDGVTAIKEIYKFISETINTSGFSGKTDALTTLRLGEASCNGKSRLFVAMLRTLGIPSRLVGGIILKDGNKTVTHQWLEVLVGNEWVTMDPTNKHFAVTPKHYLTVYYGDEPFFKRTSNVNFKYSFDIELKNYSRETNYSGLANHPMNIMNAWSLFSKAGLSMDLLRVILMIPIGAIVTVIFRNVVGLKTFGTFLPALIASSFRETNLLWGVLAFTAIILVGSVLRWGIDKLRITHTPKLTILLVFVVFSLLIISASGVLLDNMELAKATLFPLALMSITIERYALLTQESGNKEALKIYVNTIIVVVFCYIVINSLTLQTLVLAFPEAMLLVICGGLYFGNWIGIRITELFRFRNLIFEKENSNNIQTLKS